MAAGRGLGWLRRVDYAGSSHLTGHALRVKMASAAVEAREAEAVVVVTTVDMEIATHSKQPSTSTKQGEMQGKFRHFDLNYIVSMNSCEMQ